MYGVGLTVNVLCPTYDRPKRPKVQNIIVKAFTPKDFGQGVSAVSTRVVSSFVEWKHNNGKPF